MPHTKLELMPSRRRWIRRASRGRWRRRAWEGERARGRPSCYWPARSFLLNRRVAIGCEKPPGGLPGVILRLTRAKSLDFQSFTTHFSARDAHLRRLSRQGECRCTGVTNAGGDLLRGRWERALCELGFARFANLFCLPLFGQIAHACEAPSPCPTSPTPSTRRRRDRPKPRRARRP